MSIYDLIKPLIFITKRELLSEFRILFVFGRLSESFGVWEEERVV
jgi:hypothetical protein